MKKFNKILLSTTLFFSVIGSVNAGVLKATIVEENGGKTGNITWTVVDERGFLPVLEGKGAFISANLSPGRYIVSVDGDTQGRESVSIDQGVKLIKVSTRKFY